MCGLAPTLPLLIFFRVLQGAGGGGLQPTSQAILVESFPREKQGMAMAIYGMGVVVAPIIGPTFGGWLTDNYSWRWIFFINIPIGLLSLILTAALIIDPPTSPVKAMASASRLITSASVSSASASVFSRFCSIRASATIGLIPISWSGAP